MLKGNEKIFETINQLIIPIFLIIYVTILFIYLFKRNLRLKELMKSYNFIMLVFIFLVLTNFQKWYILWIFPTIIWQTKNMRKFIMNLTITAIIPSTGYFCVQGDPYTVGMIYSITILLLSVGLLSYKKEIHIINKKEKKCQD